MENLQMYSFICSNRIKGFINRFPPYFFMKLEKLLAPIKAIDEEILRNYSKITKKWEDKGRNKYKLSMMCNIPTWFFGIGTSELLYTLGISGYSKGYDCGQNLIGLLTGEHNKGTQEQKNGFVVTNPYFYNMEKIMKLIRMPLFLGGSASMIKGAINLYNSFANNEQTALGEAFQDFQLGVTFLGLTSSIYIKGSDPKVLDKKSLWDKTKDLAYNTKEKIKDLIPNPAPIPEPIPIYPNSIKNIS